MLRSTVLFLIAGVARHPCVTQAHITTASTPYLDHTACCMCFGTPSYSFWSSLKNIKRTTPRLRSASWGRRCGQTLPAPAGAASEIFVHSYLNSSVYARKGIFSDTLAFQAYAQSTGVRSREAGAGPACSCAHLLSECAPVGLRRPLPPRCRSAADRCRRDSLIAPLDGRWAAAARRWRRTARAGG